ncbi:MAG: hypothetical protein AB1758_33145 [Candidatus Eremiobacterota bacterium]
MQVDDRLPYQARARERRFKMLPRAVLSTADTYVSGATLATTMAASLPWGLSEPLAPTASAAGTALAVASAALAVGHAVVGFQALTNAPYSESTRARNLRRLQGWADLAATAGLAGQTFGILSPWAGGLAVAASLTATTASVLRSRST